MAGRKLMGAAYSQGFVMDDAIRLARVVFVLFLIGSFSVAARADSPAALDAIVAAFQAPEETDEPLRKLRPGGVAEGSAEDRGRSSAQSRQSGARPEGSGAASDPSGDSAAGRSGPAANESAALAAARRQFESGQPLEARTALVALLKQSRSEAESAAIRDLLARIADVTLFSSRPVNGDALVEVYTVQSSDRLARVVKKYDVPYEIVLRINGIADAGRISVGQRLKIPRGPFHATITKSQYRLDLYLQDVFVRSYRVGLGRENGTPTGEWRVRDRIANPTYYPPESATDRRVIAADDPSNPLGEYWIALEGISGEAVGKRGFGIHGTIEPQSIGKSESMGCVRMLNDDVAWVFSALQPGKSTVTILP